jgi:hypothetical protein
LFQLSQEGADQPLAVVRQPLAALIDKQTVKAPKIVHRENALRMASDPSLVRGESSRRGDSIPSLILDLRRREQRRWYKPSYLLSSVAARIFSQSAKFAEKLPVALRGKASPADRRARAAAGY